MKKHSLFFFVVILFFISFADAIMSYVSPIFIESQVNDAFLMGIIFSFSSMVGIICDIVFPKLFTSQPHYFFLKATLLAAVLFPLTYLLFPNHVITLLIAMGIWGIYYELNLFSSFHFVHTYVHVSEHSKTWSIIQSFQASAYALAPILVVQLLQYGYTINFIVVCLLLAIAIIFSLIFKKKFVKKQINLAIPVPQKKSWATEFRIWKLLLPKVWPLLLLEVALTTIDAGFWTVGTLLSQQLSETNELGSLFITAYIAPAIIVGFVLGKLNISSGKKRIALMSSVIAGLFFSTFHFITSIPALLLVTACASVFTGIAFPQLKAVFEDYVSRLRDKDNEMIGLQGSSTSVAFVIGPIIATFLASVSGYKSAFSILGIILTVIALILLCIVPPKIRMPQKALETT